ncbi:hypothetical protein AST00_10735 [Staphylococcus equorum]|uniref:hypothetical protein n=1 Tax=Staphylococcus equorum TaxID=246432 RepID=UPI000853AFFC|nr:hypothetical protein [Staphylococcus equorum]OEK64379.1 hypothetical protein AST00_10735 [Staphylococcus equorum]
MKIKRKVQKNLPQLIEWAWDNDDATGVRFQSDGFVTTVYFGKNGDVSVEDCSKDERFTVEVEEDITEDTEFERLVYIDDYDDTVAFSNFTIRELKDNGVKEFHAYIDGEFKLIWTKEKGLVE